MMASVEALPAPRRLAQDLNRLHDRLAMLAGVAPPDALTDADAPEWHLDVLSARMGLQVAERAAVLFIVAAELHAETRRLTALFGEGPPSIGLILRVVEGLEWRALRPDALLRHARLIVVAEGPRFTECGVAAPESVLHFLHGVTQLDPALIRLCHSPVGLPTVARDDPSVAHLLSLLTVNARHSAGVPVQIIGPDAASGFAIALESFRALGLGALILPTAVLPVEAEARDAVRALWLRDSLLHRLGLIFWATEDAPPAALVSQWAGPQVCVSAARITAIAAAPMLTLPDRRDGQLAQWQAAMPKNGAVTADDQARLAATFTLSVEAIGALARSADARDPDRLWAAAKVAARAHSHDLIERVEPRIPLSSVILPDEGARMLTDLAAAARVHHRVAAQWGGAVGARGLGLAALFAGESGTGKTMAAEAIAHACDVDLYRVELSAVVSKYIGETEKNLRRVFRDAQECGGVLLFDEADALFGKRSEVKDAHDRYANQEVGFLLQEMENFRGLAILTSNLSDTMDSAFLRRLRFVVRFPVPGVAERARIWRGVFPDGLADKALDFDGLARLSLTGGVIRNIALNASFLAAARVAPVNMADIVRATRAEFVKLDRPTSEIDARGWA